MFILKLAICIVHNRDRSRIIDELVQAGFKFTIIASTGGFLREGNTTFMVGCPEEDLASLEALIDKNCSAREQIVTVAPFEASASGGMIPSPVKVPVGGAVLFVVDVEKFSRF